MCASAFILVYTPMSMIYDSKSLILLHHALENCYASIVYTKMINEQHFTDAPLPLHIFDHIFKIPTSPHYDPFVCAESCKNEMKCVDPCILIPGSKFDTQGTRYGRGGGWYDRFLSQVPHGWIRIGVCAQENFLLDAINRESWDEPMDWVLVYNETTSSWSAAETHARHA